MQIDLSDIDLQEYSDKKRELSFTFKADKGSEIYLSSV